MEYHTYKFCNMYAHIKNTVDFKFIAYDKFFK